MCAAAASYSAAVPDTPLLREVNVDFSTSPLFMRLEDAYKRISNRGQLTE